MRRSQKKFWLRVVLLAVVGVCVVLAWREVPRPKPVATPDMASASSVAASSAPSLAIDATFTPPASPATDRERLITAGVAMLGVPYRFGAKGPDEIDCSGFTKEAYDEVGVRLPDGSFNQAEGEQALPANLTALAPGDLLFYRWPNSDAVSHVTMYAGDGWVIGTGSPGQPPYVVVYPLAEDLLDDGRVVTFRHIVLPDEQ